MDTPDVPPDVLPDGRSSAEVTGKAGRDSRGFFQPGNKIGRGNPMASKQAEYRRALHEAVSYEQMKKIAVAMSEAAQAGDVQAARFIADYTLGKPSPVEIVEGEESTSPGTLIINLVPPRA